MKRSSVDICSEEQDLGRKQKRNEEQRERYDADKRHAQYDEDKEREKIDNDAQRFRDYVDSHLVFDVCAICAFEGPSVDFYLLDDLMEFVEQSNYVKSFVEYCSKLSLGSSQDKAFLLAIENEFSDNGFYERFQQNMWRMLSRNKTQKEGVNSI